MKSKPPEPIPRITAHKKKHGAMPEMPPLSCEYSRYLRDLFFIEINPSIEEAQGLSPLKWHEIESWCRMSRRTISPSEALLMRNLSKDYISQYSLSSDPACEAPWTPATIDREQVGDAIDAFFDRLEAAQQKQQKASGAGDGIRRR